MIDHLICDCDGVLVDSEIIADRVMLETLTATFPGLDFEAVVKTAFGQQTSRFLESIEKSFDITLPADFFDTIEHNVELELAASLEPDQRRARSVATRDAAGRGRVEQPHGARERVGAARGFAADFRRADFQRGTGGAAEAVSRRLSVRRADAGRGAVAMPRGRRQRRGIECGARGGHENDRFRRREPYSGRLCGCAAQDGHDAHHAMHMDELPALVEAGMRGEFGDVQS